MKKPHYSWPKVGKIAMLDFYYEKPQNILTIISGPDKIVFVVE